MRYIYCFSLLVSLCCISHTVAEEPRKVASQPNIVFILADDLGYGELGCYGQKKIKTPNLDQLAAQGICMMQQYAGAPVCAPSRATFMTGLHLGHSPIRGNKDPKNAPEGQWPLPAGIQSLPLALKEAGYSTGAMGKWGLGYPGSTGDVNQFGFNRFFGYNCQREAHSYYPDHLWSDSTRIPFNDKAIPGHVKLKEGEAVALPDVKNKKHATTAIMDEALNFIDKNATEKKPFFLYLALTEPHVALHPEHPELVDTYPKDWDAKPYRGAAGYSPHPRPRAAYAAMITGLDANVGRVLAALDKNKLSENTIVVFTGDNGTTHDAGGVDSEFFNSTGGLRGRKGSVYEGGLRTPCIVRWTGHIKPGTKSDFPCYFPDYFPTFCEIAGAKSPASLDGISVAKAWTGESRLDRKTPMLWVFPEYGGKVAVRLGDFMVMRNNLLTKKVGPWEAYDLVNDPSEKKNVANEHPELIEKAIAVLKEQATENATFPVPIPGKS
jgi:arylsulfatase A